MGKYREVLFNTFFIAASIVVLGLIFGLAIAYLAFQPVKGAFFYRTLLIWPYAISPAIAGIIFFVMFDPVSGDSGRNRIRPDEQRSIKEGSFYRLEGEIGDS